MNYYHVSNIHFQKGIFLPSITVTWETLVDNMNKVRSSQKERLPLHRSMGRELIWPKMAIGINVVFEEIWARKGVRNIASRKIYH